MTTVHISLGRDDGTDQTAAKGVVEWEPTTRREDGTMVILERGFTVPLVAGEATVTVDPSGLTWCWRVTERTDSGGVVRYVSVPDSAAVVEYVDLPDVDPTTLVAWSPADPEAAYQTALDNLDVETAVETYLLANPVSAPVDSVNGQTGAVTLDAADVGADPAGTAAGLVGALAIPDSADDVGAIPEPAVEGASGDVLVTDGAGGRTWATPDAGGVTSVDGQTGAVSLSSTYARIPTGTPDGTKYLRDDNSWQPVAGGGTGDVVGPASATDAHVVLFNGATGKLIKSAGAAFTPAGIGAAPALGADDNYVTDAEKAALHTHPAVIAQGATQADARTAIGAGTSNLVIGTTAGTAKEGNYAPDLSGLVAKSLVDAKGDLLVATAADTVARLPVGATTGHVLTVDPAEAAGMKWAAGGGGGADPWTYYVVSSDVTTTSNTASNVNGLSIPSGLAAGSYQIHVFVVGTHSGGGGFGYQVLNPTGGEIRGQQNVWRGALEVSFAMMHVEATTNAGVSYIGMHYEARAVMTVASGTTTAINVAFRSITNGSTTVVKPGSFIAIRKTA